jgi:hypothetical protein
MTELRNVGYKNLTINQTKYAVFALLAVYTCLAVIIVRELSY